MEMKPVMNWHELQRQVKMNFIAFRRELPSIAPEHSGKFALMRDECIVDYFDSAPDAVKFGDLKFPDGVFSIQEVTERMVDLGFYSSAIAI